MPEKLFITLSPPSRTMQYARNKFKNPNKCVYIDDISIIKNTFRRNKIKQYICCPEFDNKGRLHYHIRATVTPSQKVSIYKSVRPTLERLGYVDVQPVKHDVENLIYCLKSFKETSQILEIDRPVYGILSETSKKIIKEDNSNKDILDYFNSF